MSSGENVSWERSQGYPFRLICGVDEVGRGCLAGPVVAGAVVLPQEPDALDPDRYPWLALVTDSKKLTPAKREYLEPRIRGWARACAIGSASVEEIDRINIHHASHLAMVRAVEGLGAQPEHVLVDGSFVPKALEVPASAIVKGDLRCLSIACASIVAKVWRDRHLVELDQEYPGYGFAAHKGYPTPVHLEAIRAFGVLGIHRKSFSLPS